MSTTRTHIRAETDDAEWILAESKKRGISRADLIHIMVEKERKLVEFLKPRRPKKKPEYRLTA